MGRIDLPDVRRHEDDDYGRGRVETWKRLIAEGNAGEACDLVIRSEVEMPPPALLEDLASAPIVRECQITGHTARAKKHRAGRATARTARESQQQKREEPL